MDPVFVATREELHDVQMELKRVQHVQQLQGERLRSLEKRQADDAALKSVWNSPFPSVLGGTPQHGEAPSIAYPALFSSLLTSLLYDRAGPYVIDRVD